MDMSKLLPSGMMPRGLVAVY